jgi:hypothetical protein
MLMAARPGGYYYRGVYLLLRDDNKLKQESYKIKRVCIIPLHQYNISWKKWDWESDDSKMQLNYIHPYTQVDYTDPDQTWQQSSGSNALD